MQRRYRWRGGIQGQPQDSMGGRRGGWGRGAGGRGGYGRQYRGGWKQDMPGPARRLQLTPEQNTWIGQQDPNFEDQSARLRDRLYQAHEAVVACLENIQTTDQELAAKIADLVTAHSALERRVAEHIVLLRPQLSQAQRELLAELCRGRPAGDDDLTSKGPDSLGDSLAGFSSMPVLADLF